MDLTAVDVTALPPGSARSGDEAEVIGPSRGIDAVAKAAGTIGYEVLTALGRRFHRRAA
jgi:alanine racemase